MTGYRLLTFVLAAFFVGALSVQGADTLPLNEPYKGKTQETVHTINVFIGKKALQKVKVAAHTVQVDLKKGQSLEMSINATSDDRTLVGVVLLDKEGAVVAQSWKPATGPGGGPRPKPGDDPVLTDFGRGFGQLNKVAIAKIESIPANGEYTIKILADRECDFVLIAKGPAQNPGPKTRSAETIRKEIESLKKQLNELEQELKEKEKGTDKIGK